MFLGEYKWSPASHYFMQQYINDVGWERPRNCPAEILPAAIEYVSESGGYDCSIDESFSLRLPVADLLGGLDLKWAGEDADFIDTSGQLVAFDPATYEAGPSALLFREDRLRDLLERKKLAICWAILGEKRVIGPGLTSPKYYEGLRLSGAYTLDPKGLKGFLNGTLASAKREESGLFQAPQGLVQSIN
jgi:hypothetical protein